MSNALSVSRSMASFSLSCTVSTSPSRCASWLLSSAICTFGSQSSRSETAISVSHVSTTWTLFPDSVCSVPGTRMTRARSMSGSILYGHSALAKVWYPLTRRWALLLSSSLSIQNGSSNMRYTCSPVPLCTIVDHLSTSVSVTHASASSSEGKYSRPLPLSPQSTSSHTPKMARAFSLRLLVMRAGNTAIVK